MWIFHDLTHMAMANEGVCGKSARGPRKLESKCLDSIGCASNWTRRVLLGQSILATVSIDYVEPTTHNSSFEPMDTVWHQ
jgi:hypothetical protein